MIKSPYLISLLALLLYFFLLLLPFLIIILIILPLVKLKKYKVSLKEIIFYLFFYGLLPLIMPFFFFTFLFLFFFSIFNLLLDKAAIGMDFSKSIEKLGFVVLPLLILMTLFFYTGTRCLTGCRMASSSSIRALMCQMAAATGRIGNR